MSAKNPIVICGLGMRPELDATLETLEALASCQIVFAVGPRRSMEPLLRRLGTPVRYGADPAEIAEAARRRKVGVAYVGHAVTTSSDAARLIALCGRLGLPYRVLASVSPIGSALSRAVAFMGGGRFGWLGVQAVPLEQFSAGRAPRAAGALPLVVFSQDGTADWKDLSRLLSPLYPPGHRVRLFPAEGPELETPLAGLEGSADAVVLVPSSRRGKLV